MGTIWHTMMREENKVTGTLIEMKGYFSSYHSRTHNEGLRMLETKCFWNLRVMVPLSWKATAGVACFLLWHSGPDWPPCLKAKISFWFEISNSCRLPHQSSFLHMCRSGECWGWRHRFIVDSLGCSQCPPSPAPQWSHLIIHMKQGGR